MDSTLLSASSGGVGENTVASQAFRTSRATKRERYVGFSSSPLLMSIHFTVIGGLPCSLNASSRGTFWYTFFATKYSISSRLAAWTSSDRRDCPVMLSLKVAAPVHFNFSTSAFSTSWLTNLAHIFSSFWSFTSRSGYWMPTIPSVSLPSSMS